MSTEAMTLEIHPIIKKQRHSMSAEAMTLEIHLIIKNKGT